jgi:hypothetical protein
MIPVAATVMLMLDAHEHVKGVAPRVQGPKDFVSTII